MATDKRPIAAAATSTIKRVKTDIKDMFRDSVFTFSVGPQEENFEVHPKVLSSLSPAFDALMENGMMKESMERKAKLPETEPETFTLLLEYAYTGTYSYGLPKEPFEDLANAELQKHIRWCLSCGSSLKGPDWKCLKLSCAAAATHSIAPQYCGNCGGHLQACKNQEGCQGFKFASNVRDTRLLERTYEVDGSVLETKSAPTGKLLQHGKLYMLADQYMMESLKQLCLAKLHYELCLFQLNTTTIGEACALIKYINEQVFESGSFDKEKPLVDLVLDYVILDVADLVSHQEYQDLMGEGGSSLAEIATIAIICLYTKVTRLGRKVDVLKWKLLGK